MWSWGTTLPPPCDTERQQVLLLLLERQHQRETCLHGKAAQPFCAPTCAAAAEVPAGGSSSSEGTFHRSNMLAALCGATFDTSIQPEGQSCYELLVLISKTSCA